MASDNDASCENDPNFAVICAFLEKFGDQCGLPSMDILDLRDMLENSDEVPARLYQLILKLLRRVKRSVKPDKWERTLVGICHTFSSQDAWEIERFGFKKAKVSSKVRALKELLEMQFDYHVKFKNEVNKLTAEQLRSQPLGRDKAGHAYWFQSDDNYQIRVYKEDLDEETWTLIAKDRESLVLLITKLSDGEAKFSSDSAANEDSNSLSEKPVIDTGQDVDSKKGLEESENSSEAKEKTEDKDKISEAKSEQESGIPNDDDIQEGNGLTNGSKPRPLLRIKNLSELMGSSTKKSRLDDESEEKILKQTNNDKGPIIGKEIEEPVMKIQGEGTGAENKCSPAFFNGDESLENPIVGEVIEEDLMHFYGEGSGADCQTGNDEKPSTSKTCPKSDVLNQNSTEATCINSSSDSIKNNLSGPTDNKDKSTEVPSIKLGKIFDSKTDKYAPKLPKSPTRKIRWDMEKSEKESDCKDLHVTSKPKELVEKCDQVTNDTQEEKSIPIPNKSSFFFGSIPKTSVSPLLSFGGISREKEINEEKETSIQTSKTEPEQCVDGTIVDEKKNHPDNGENLRSSKCLQCDNEETNPDSPNKNDVNINEGVASDDVKSLNSKIVDTTDSSPKTDLAEKNVMSLNNTENSLDNDVANGSKCEEEKSNLNTEGKDQTKLITSTGDMKMPASVNTEDGNQEESIKPVVEPICVKKGAYVCGDDSPEQKEVDLEEKKKSDTDFTTDNDIEKNRRANEISEVDRKEDLLRSKTEKNEKEVRTSGKSENVKTVPADVIDENAIVNDSQIEISNSVIAEDKSKLDTHSEGETKQFELSDNTTSKTEVKRQTSLRSVRSKRTQNKDSDVQQTFIPSMQSSKSEGEAKEQPPTERNRKPNEELPPSEPQETDKNPNLEEVVKKDNAVTEITVRRSVRGKGANKPEEKEDKSKNEIDKSVSVASANSSGTNSPVTTVDTILVVPDSAENSMDILDKDPLADTDEEPPPVPKTINLQSFSMDYNESATPPPIPIIPSRRLLRKRGREGSPESHEVPIPTGKKLKLKGKRQIDKTLRKSIEKKKEEQVSSSDEEKDVSEEESKAAIKSSKKKVKQIKSKKEDIEISDDDSDTPAPKPKKKYKCGKNSRLLANLGITGSEPVETGGRNLRQSRRIAQQKIKEQAEIKRPEPKPIKEKEDKIKKTPKDKESKVDKKKEKEKPVKETTPESDVEPEDNKRKKKKKFKAPSKIFDESRPWRSSSESSDEAEEDVEEEEEVVEEEEPVLEFKSDHEFSPESDLEADGEALPLRRARTARKKYGEETDAEDEEVDDCPCQKCGKSDHPEWILLCDKCDNGWHCSCLRPPLLVIPEGDWHCPPCQHILLVERLQEKLIEYDKKLTKKELEDRRKERLAYVGISLNNVLPSKEHEHRKKKRRHSEEGTESSSEASKESSDEYGSSDSDEPIYQLRQRREAKSYKFNEYDDLIKSAIQDEMEEKNQEMVAIQSHGKDMATIVRAEQEERNEREQAEINENKPETADKSNDNVDEEKEELETIKPNLKQPVGRKKKRKINNLDISSEEDDEKDEDFKGVSSESEEEEDEEEVESDEESDDYYAGRKRGRMRPLRRSTRARTSRYDADFVNDDEDDFDEAPKKKKRKKYWSETESEDSDRSWGRRNRGGRSSKKMKKKSILDELSDIEPVKKKRRKIKYGGLTSSEEDMGRGRRTRGKKTTYVDTLGSDSEEDNRRKTNPRRIESDDDEDFIANEEDEKDSEEAQDDPEDEDQEGESCDRRTLIVPKIYIKKPPVTAKKIANNEPKESSTVAESAEEQTKTMEDEPVEEMSQFGKESQSQEKAHPVESRAIEELTEKGKSKKATAESSADREKQVEVNRDDTRKCEAEQDKQDTESGKTLVQELNQKDLVKDNLMEENGFGSKQITLQNEIDFNTKAREEIKQQGKVENVVQQMGPAKRGRKPKPKETPQMPQRIIHEPIVSNVRALIRNDDSNDELSEPPGVTLPMFEELAAKRNDEESPKKRRGRGKGKKTLEETLANLEGKKKASENTSQGCNIEIAAPPQPFSQEAPTPSVITRMLQTTLGQTTTYPVGTIRPKQFATMPADDDDSPSSIPRENSPSTGGNMGQLGGPPGQFMAGGPRGPVGGMFRSLHPNMNQYPRGVLPPHQLRGPPPSGPPHIYHPHRPHDPSPSGGGAINMTHPNTPPLVPPPTSSPGKVEPQNYSRPPSVNRYPPINSPSSLPMTPPRPVHVMGHIQQSRPSNLSPYPPPGTPPNYYGVYPADSIANEDAMPPTAFQNAPYQEQFPEEMARDPSEHSNSKSYGGEESGGEFGGLVSYFSSQREDDLES